MVNVKRVQVANVILWGQDVGAVAWNEEQQLGQFEYTSRFLENGLEIAPLTMPLQKRIFSFPALNHVTFHGLPGLLAEALPDRYGNALIDIWLQKQGRDVESFSSVERLCYMGKRSMGALEFQPALMRSQRKSVPLDVFELASLAAEILQSRKKLSVGFNHHRTEALNTIIRVGTSAGGARAKAVIAWNPVTCEVRSGQIAIPEGFEPWLLKFDGVADESLGDPKGYGKIEYAYYQMAMDCGITMNVCRLLHEENRSHFMTKRFDRDEIGNKIHMQSLCALGHYDFNMPGATSYEHAFSTIQKLHIGYDTIEQLYRRMVFNVVARNQDDHTRNISFLMNRQGQWRLAPAYDVIWCYNPKGPWTSKHQMRINGKSDDFDKTDILSVANQFGIRNANHIFKHVQDIVSDWPRYAKNVCIVPEITEFIQKTHRFFKGG